MTTVIKPKRSTVPLSVPAAGNLEVGELAINIPDGKLYTKNTDGTIKELGGAGSVTLQGATNAGNVTTNNLVLNGSNLIFEGLIENAFETTLTVQEPTSDRLITLPNQSGTVATVDDALALSIVFGG
jgi:phosphoribosylformylglycinamidine (FGAM) synthase-like amidotransferase family enzyme